MKRYTWTPAIGAHVTLKQFNDYTSRNIHVWSRLEVQDVQLDLTGMEIGIEVLNGNERTGQRLAVPLSAVAVPIGWHERYTIEVSRDKEQDVIGWLARGIAVRQSHYMPSCPTAFQPLDNCDTPDWRFSGDTLVDRIPPADVQDRIKIVRVESHYDAFVMRPCRYCVNGKRTRENNTALNDRIDKDCPKCGAVMGFSFDRPYHDVVMKAYSVETETDASKIVECPKLRPAAECWVCNGTGLAAKYVSETDAKGTKRNPSERQIAIDELRAQGWKVWYQKRGYQNWVMERETVLKEWGESVRVAEKTEVQS